LNSFRKLSGLAGPDHVLNCLFPDDFWFPRSQIMRQLYGTESLTSEPSHPLFQALLARLDPLLSSAPIKAALGAPVFGIGLGLSSLWMLLPELLRSKPLALPFDRIGAGTASAPFRPANSAIAKGSNDEEDQG
jgi:hypothetical protein